MTPVQGHLQVETRYLCNASVISHLCPTILVSIHGCCLMHSMMFLWSDPEVLAHHTVKASSIEMGVLHDLTTMGSMLPFLV